MRLAESDAVAAGEGSLGFAVKPPKTVASSQNAKTANVANPYY